MNGDREADQVGWDSTIHTLADLDSGVLDEQSAYELRRRISDNPDAEAIMAAFAAVRRDLAQFRHDDNGPALPPELASRIRSAVQDEIGRRQAPGPTRDSSPMPPVLVPPPTAPSAIRRRMRTAAVLLSAVAVIVAIVSVNVVLRRGADAQTPFGVSAPASTAQPASAWSSASDAPSAREFSGGTVADGSLWTFGGLLTGNAPTTTVVAYDSAINTWLPGIDLPFALHHLAAVTFRNEIVVLGGWRPEGGNLTATVSDKVLVQRAGGWTELPPLLRPRAALAATVVGDRIVVVGGQANGRLVPTTEVFDGIRWTEAAPLPTPREDLTVATDGRFVYAVGGRQLPGDTDSAALERFDPATGQWQQLPNMPTARSGAGAAYSNGRIVVVGGEQASRALGVVEAYIISTGKWQSLAPLRVPRIGLVVGVVGNSVLAVNGARGPTPDMPTATAEILSLP